MLTGMESAQPSQEQAEISRQLKKRSQLDRFVVRLRIVAEHSLAEDRQRLVDLCEHRWEFLPPATPGGGPRIKPVSLLPVEQVESAIARIRPLLLKDDGISYKQVLGALGETLSAEDREELALWREEFEDFDPDANAGRPKEPHVPGTPVANTRIGSSWLYGDLVHADANRQSFTSRSTPEFVFVEAQRMTCGLMLASLHTLDFLRRLHEQEAIDVSDESFTRQVTVAAREWAPTLHAVYSAEEGTAFPGSFDDPLDEGWTKVL